MTSLVTATIAVNTATGIYICMVTGFGEKKHNVTVYGLAVNKPGNMGGKQC